MPLQLKKNDKTDKNDANTWPWHIVNACFWTSTSYKAIQLTCFGVMIPSSVLYSKHCLAQKVENNLSSYHPRITD